MSRPDTVTTPTQAIGLIARREVRERAKTKSFAILTGALAAIIIAIGIIIRFVDADGDTTTEIAVADPLPGFADVLEATAAVVDRDLTITVIDADDARETLDDSSIDAALLTEERTVIYDGSIDAELQAIVQHAWSSAAVNHALIDAGIDPAEAEGLASPGQLAATTLDGDDDDDAIPPAAVLVGTMVGILLFVSLQVFGNYALAGVVEEKSTAVVEVLLVRVRATQLLAGKLLGLGAVALFQVIVAIAAGGVALVTSGADIPSGIWAALPTALLWYLGGFALYATLYALAGSLVSRQEDAQAAAAPISTVLIGAYVLMFVVGYAPYTLASRILSVLPPISPFLMPMRMAAGAASVAEIVLALVLLFGSAVVGWRLCGRIYEQVLLRRGTRIPWRDALALRSGA